MIFYVVEFNNGVIKVGQTGQWPRRLRSHQEAAAAHGVDVVRTWLKEGVVPGREEAEALRAFKAAGHHPHAGREWFNSLSFEEAIELAEAAWPSLEARDEAAEEAILAAMAELWDARR